MLVYQGVLSFFTEQMCHLTCRRNANFFQKEFPVFSNRMYWKLSAGHKREAVRWMWERLVGSHTWKLCPWSLASKKWGALEAPWQMTPIRAAFVVPKHVTLPEKMRLAWLVSIPLALLTSSEVLSCAGGPVMSLDTLEKCHLLPERIPSFVEQNVLKSECQLVPVRIPSLFKQNVLKAVGRTQEGSCKVYAGKTTWKTNWKLYPWSLASKKWGALEAPWQMTPIRAAFTCCKACDRVGEDESALLVSIPAPCSIKRQCMTRTQMAILVDFQNEIGRTQSSHFLFLNIARRPQTTQSDLHLSSWTFLEASIAMENGLIEDVFPVENRDIP